MLTRLCLRTTRNRVTRASGAGIDCDDRAWPRSTGCIRQKGRPAGHGRVPCAADGEPSRWADKARNGLPNSGFLSRVRPALFAQCGASAPADAVNTLRCQSITFTLRLMSSCLLATDPPHCERSIVSHNRPFWRMHPDQHPRHPDLEYWRGPKRSQSRPAAGCQPSTAGRQANPFCQWRWRDGCAWLR